MSQDRILGSQSTLHFYGPTGPVHLAELDSFTAKARHDAKVFKPLGQQEEHEQLIYKGYDLTFKGAKVRADWESIQDWVDDALLSGVKAPRFRVVDTTTWYDGTTETTIYDDVLLKGFEMDKSSAGEEIKQSFSGFAPRRIRVQD